MSRLKADCVTKSGFKTNERFTATQFTLQIRAACATSRRLLTLQTVTPPPSKRTAGTGTRFDGLIDTYFRIRSHPLIGNSGIGPRTRRTNLVKNKAFPRAAAGDAIRNDATCRSTDPLAVAEKNTPPPQTTTGIRGKLSQIIIVIPGVRRSDGTQQ